MSDDDLQKELDELYKAPLEDFTARRNELVRKLRVSGDRDLAEAVRGLAKPSVAAWAVNQLAFNHPDEVDALMEAGERLRNVQEWLLRREADGSLVPHADLGGLPSGFNEIVVDGRGNVYVNGADFDFLAFLEKATLPFRATRGEPECSSGIGFSATSHDRES